MNGPFLTIYGFGAVFVYMTLRPLEGKWPLLFLSGAVLATILELVTAEILEAIFHTSWWDYTGKKWNFQGKICAESTICWGFFTLLMFYILQPGVSWTVRQVDVRAGKVLILIITVIYCIDFGISAAAAFALDHKIRKMEKLREEMLEIFQRNRLTEAAEDASQRFALIRREKGRKVRVYPGKAIKTMKGYMDRMRQESGQKLDGLIEFSTEKKNELFLRREQVKKEILDRMERAGMVWGKNEKPIEKTIHRYVDAYPNLNHVQKVVKKSDNKESAEGLPGSEPKDCRQINVNGSDYLLVKDVMTDEKRRGSYNALAEKTFGIDFEPWYQNGGWSEKNQPYTLYHQGRAVANVSVNRMKIRDGGKIYSCIQLGTVMTDEEYRNRGLAGRLMKEVLEDIESSCDMVFLFANQSALGFYPKFGFERQEQFLYSCKLTCKGEAEKIRKLDSNIEKDREILREYYEKGNPFSEIQETEDFGLLMFAWGAFLRNCVAYLEQEEAVVLYSQEGKVLRVWDVYCEKDRCLTDILSQVGTKETETVLLEFTPVKKDDFEVQKQDDEDDVLFIWKERKNYFQGRKILFPVISHT